MIFGLRLFRKKLDEHERRIAALEAALHLVPERQGMRFENSLPIQTEYSAQSAYHPARQPMNQAPWVSKTVRIGEQLTSFEYAVKAQFWQAGLFTLIGTIISALINGTFDLRMTWYTPFLFGLATGAVALSILLMDHRDLVRQLVRDAGHRPKKLPELKVAISEPQANGASSRIKFLYLNGKIDHEDIQLFAHKVSAGKSLAVHSWSGIGGWTRPKLDNFFTELETMGYVEKRGGNQGRILTRAGKNLFKAISEGKL